ncbi:hypothetical protein LMG29739_03487 [Paraburkholderia solisilvae]|uniref:Uncharacterized protein n=1 Tax=Paraburkholderia solisilvae TaxID=624376 RepID=A0A6J5E336_9BURK|nr:hypothetical protein LMG29739_03487 [Paraburkholderia solisilvae]
MPVSRTSMRSAPGSFAKMSSATSPCSVNFNAFDNRLRRICARRCPSVTIVSGTPGARCAVNFRCFVAAIGSNISRSDCSSASTGTFAGSIVSCPASTFDRSRMSLISTSRSLFDAWMVSA